MAYIEREKAKELIKNFGKGAIEDGQYALDSVDDIILLASAVDLIPSVDAVEVVHGEWAQLDNDHFNCSQCGNIFGLGSTATLYNVKRVWHYCPNCGAKMDGKRKVSE